LKLKIEVLQLTTTVDASGHLKIDIPTQLALGQVNVVLVLNSVLEAKEQHPNYDFSDLVGRLTWQGDAVAMQRALRDEW
jgi:hypothetical protein